MKHLIYALIISLFFCNNSNAQTTFAPPGSEWYHSMDDPFYGVFHSYYGGDTVIAGVACRKIVRDAETADPVYSSGLLVSNLNTLYVYNTPDTVFLYNGFFNRFTPLYVFNVNDGDTVRLPILPIDVNELIIVSADSTFSFRVDSVRMVEYDTAMLKTVYTHSIGAFSSTYVYNYNNNEDSVGMYTERIGEANAGFLPSAAPAVNLLDDHYHVEGKLRCYNDPTLSIKMDTGICGIPPTAVNVVQAIPISIFPNPAFDVLNITGIAAGNNEHVSIINMAGSVVLTQVCTARNNVLSVATLPAGMYILKLTDERGASEYRKISVQR